MHLRLVCCKLCRYALANSILQTQEVEHAHTHRRHHHPFQYSRTEQERPIIEVRRRNNCDHVLMGCMHCLRTILPLMPGLRLRLGSSSIQVHLPGATLCNQLKRIVSTSSGPYFLPHRGVIHHKLRRAFSHHTASTLRHVPMRYSCCWRWQKTSQVPDSLRVVVRAYRSGRKLQRAV